LSDRKGVWPVRKPLATLFPDSFLPEAVEEAAGKKAVKTTGSPLVIGVEVTEDSKPKDGRR